MKLKTREIFCIGVMACLALNVIWSVFRFFANIILAIAHYSTFSVATAFTLFLTGLSCLALLAFVAVVAFEQFRQYKDKIKKLWFVPGIPRVIVVLISLVSSFASLGYLRGLLIADTILSTLLTFVVNLVYVGTFYVIFPKLLMEMDIEPVFKKKQPAPANSAYPNGILTADPQQPITYQQPVYQAPDVPQQDVSYKPPAYQPSAAPQEPITYQQPDYQAPAAPQPDVPPQPAPSPTSYPQPGEGGTPLQ